MCTNDRLVAGFCAVWLLAPVTAFPTTVVPVEPVEPDPSQCSAERPEWCLDGVGGGVTSLDSLRVTTTGPESRRADDEERSQQQARASLPGVRGAAAASESMAGWNVWGSGGWQAYESTVNIAPYDADAVIITLGADRFFGDNYLAGFTLGYENHDVEVTYNGGDQDKTGLQGALYGAVLLDDTFSIDAAIGYAWLDTDETRIDPGTSVRVGTTATPGARLSSSYDSERWFATANLNALRTYGEWVVGARVGLLYAEESQDAYTETGGGGARSIGKRNVDLTQGYISFDVGYSAGAFEPYVLLGYRYDFSSDDGSSAGGLPAGIRTQPDDDDEWQGGLGVRYFGESGVSGSLEWLRTEGRKDFDADSVTLLVRVPF